ncbi:phage head closure protein [Palleronia sp.]|uniref:phage head closure protein n=1 Tax=Palleronia sp. TaxID=1940284 RepID=UPI0035C7910B
MTSRALFQVREEVDDGFGNTYGAWVDRFTRWCHVRFLRGGETVIAARLVSRQPAIITIRHDAETATIAPAMRCVIAGRSFDIKEQPRLSDDRQTLTFLAETEGGPS